MGTCIVIRHGYASACGFLLLLHSDWSRYLTMVRISALRLGQDGNQLSLMAWNRAHGVNSRRLSLEMQLMNDQKRLE